VVLPKIGIILVADDIKNWLTHPQVSLLQVLFSVLVNLFEGRLLISSWSARLLILVLAFSTRRSQTSLSLSLS